MKKLVALALGTVMAVSMTAGVSAATVESKDDLKNATIGVQLGTTGDIEASEYEADGATVKRYSKGSEAIQALMAGQIDCEAAHPLGREWPLFAPSVLLYASHS